MIYKKNSVESQIHLLQSKRAGRRKTNSCRHRKGEPAIIIGRAGLIREVERPFDVRRLTESGKKMEKLIFLRERVVLCTSIITWMIKCCRVKFRGKAV